MDAYIRSAGAVGRDLRVETYSPCLLVGKYSVWETELALGYVDFGHWCCRRFELVYIRDYSRQLFFLGVLNCNGN